MVWSRPRAHRALWRESGRRRCLLRTSANSPFPPAAFLEVLSESRRGPTATSGSPRRRQQDRPDHAGRRHHRVRHPHRQQPPTGSPPGRTATSGSPSTAADKIGRITHSRRHHRVPIPTASSQPVRHHGRAGRQPLVHRAQRQQDRPDHHRPAPSPSSPSPRPAAPHADHRRAGRQPLVHREQRQQDRPDHARPASSPSSPSPPPAVSPAGITAGPDGNLWFTESERQQDRPDHHRRRHHRVRRSPRPAAARAASRPGPDGNLWFTESDGNKIGRITTGGVITEFPIPTRRQPARRDRGRAGRQPLVHRERGNKIGRITTPA